MSFIHIENCTKTYHAGDTVIIANQQINFDIEKGELVIIVGASGAGKSTLLNIIGGMESVDDGIVEIDGKNIAQYNEQQLTAYRRNDVGFIFQFYNLISNLTTVENVELACEIVQDALDPVETLKQVGLGHRLNNFPSQLSGGEQQRVAIARAVAKNPKILLCDEPTGALDYETGKQVLKILQDKAQKDNATVIIVTHNLALAPIANRVIYMKDAKIYNIDKNETPMPIELLTY